MSHINLDLQASHKMLMLLDEANTNTESVIDLIPGIFLVVNEQHEVLRANHEFVNLVGVDQEAALRLPLSKFFRRKNWDIFAHQIKKLIATSGTAAAGTAIKFELDMSVGGTEGEAGRPFHWILTNMEVRNKSEGRLLTVFGHDMSEMRETEKRLAEVFTSIPLGIFTLNRDGTVGSAYSSYLESMLDCGTLGGRKIDEVLFKPALPSMDSEAIKGIAAVTACMGHSELEFAEYAKRFPQEIFHNVTMDPERGRWFKITYQPIVFDRMVEQLLIILEDRTAIVNAERDMTHAAIEREQSLAVYESAIRDPLTGLYTRLYMKEAVDVLIANHDKGAVPQVSMVIFDIDHFKRVNDTYGHKNGDLILSRVAAVVLAQCGDAEIPIRFGGEEFIVFTPFDCEYTLRLAEKVRLEVEALKFDLDDATIKVTISGGVASHRAGEPMEDFMHRADTLLYTAKKSGRNQNVVETK